MQFAGSSSTGGRRRRRLVVNSEGTGVDIFPADGDAAEIESRLVASAAAAPWVPVTELRIWIYASVIAVALVMLTIALIRPFSLADGLDRITDHLLAGTRPRLLVVAQTSLLALSTQMGLLIAWYRSRCSLDFGGRYRVWPWAVVMLGMATFCSVTHVHQTIGSVIGQIDWFTWRGATVAWILPLCVIGLPITLLLDRDVRNSRSSLYTLRLSGALWLLGALLELYEVELQSKFWYGIVRQMLPVFASATLFVGLWLHARIVAYVCPDPPKLEERSAWSLLREGSGWLANRLMSLRKATRQSNEEEEVTKPKRRRKKADEETATDSADAPVKRKRKAPVKRAAPRTRKKVKPVEQEIEELEENFDESSNEEPESDFESTEMDQETSSSFDDEASQDDDGDQWNEEPEEAPQTPVSVPESRGTGRYTQVHNTHASSIPAPHDRRAEQSYQQSAEPVPVASSEYEEGGDESDEDSPTQYDSDLNPDQLRGLSKRQKRDLKKQQRDKERGRGR